MANEKNTKIALNVKGQRSNVTNFQPLLAFTMGHIPTMLHQFLIISFRNFVRIDRQTDTQTPPKTIPARSMRAGIVQHLHTHKFLM